MIERLYVHNFRCLQNFTLDLAGKPSVVLIGKNGAGKSTVLASLELIQAICRGAGRVGTLLTSSDFFLHRTTEPMRFEVELRLGARKYRYSISFDWPVDYRQARILDESLSVDGTEVFTRHLAEVQLSNGAKFGLDWHIFALPVINERPPARSIQDVKAFFASTVFIAPVPREMTGFAEELSNQLLHDAGNYGACLQSLLAQKPAAYSVFASYVKTAIPDFSSLENVPRGETGTQLIVKFEQQHPQRDFAVEFKSLSDGEKCFFLSAYLIASNTVGFQITSMWNEPDNHLSLSEVGQFVMNLRKMTNRGGQFIATTHHPETVRKFSDETTFVLTRKSHLDPAIVRPLTDFEYSGDLIDALIRDEIIG